MVVQNTNYVQKSEIRNPVLLKCKNEDGNMNESSKEAHLSSGDSRKRSDADNGRHSHEEGGSRRNKNDRRDGRSVRKKRYHSDDEDDNSGSEDEDVDRKDDSRDRRRSKRSDDRKRQRKDRDVAESKRDSKKRSRRRDREEDDNSDREDSDRRRSSRSRSRRKKKKRKRESKHRKSKDDRRRSRRRRRRKEENSSSSSSSSSSEDESSSSDSSSDDDDITKDAAMDINNKKKILNPRLLAKLAERGETLEEREERRAKRRAARVASHFGYTPENNPFNDPNLHDTFTWKKKEQQQQEEDGSNKKNKKSDDSGKKGSSSSSTAIVISERGPSTKRKEDHILEEIEKVRRRRQEREEHQDEMERMRAEEAKMRELANYDEWARKEEEFHLQQQRQRSAIRLLEHREQPIDVLAKNLLLFGLSTQDKANRAKVKYQERFDALSEIETSLEAELVEPHVMLHDLTLDELQTLLDEMINFRNLEREAMLAAQRDHEEEHQKNKGDSGTETGPSSLSSSEMIIKYWNNLITVCEEEIRQLKEEQNSTKQQLVTTANLMDDIRKLFAGKNRKSLDKMKREMEQKISASSNERDNMTYEDKDYWKTVLQQLEVHIAKEELSELHNVMLVRQLERLEQRKEELGQLKGQEPQQKEQSVSGGVVSDGAYKEGKAGMDDNIMSPPSDILPVGVEPDFGNLEESLGLNAEVTLDPSSVPYEPWMDRYRPRKPRYFNRVKTGYDWNKYNQTHYDHDNPPPKIVQGYKFNVFYPDLLDRTKTPQYKLEPCVGDPTNEFCILRFTAGPPYEDIAFKIINREWNRSRKRGFRSTFERGVLSLYFNFKSHWYRR